MSLAAIQDNLVKTTLVQHTQSKADDVSRSQESSILAKQQEDNRQVDQVVIHSRQTDEEKNLKADDEKEKERRRRKGRDRDTEAREKNEDDDEDGPGGPRARMRRINIVI